MSDKFYTWWEEESRIGGELSTECRLAKAAWNAAIWEAALAIESADHNSDDSGIGANCAAMTAVEKLEAK